jgi:hypothetical protein
MAQKGREHSGSDGSQRGGRGRGCCSGLGYCVGTPLIVREEYEKKRGKRRGRISGDGE